MDFRRTGVVQELDGFPQLGAANDGVVHEQQLLALDEFRDGDLFHFCHTVPDFLRIRCEGTGPGGGVFHEGSCKRLVAVVGVADGVGHTGIGNTGHEIHVGESAPLHFATGHGLTVAVAHDFHVFAFVIGVGVAIIGPQEGADLHFLSCGGQGLPAVGGDHDDLAGAKLVNTFAAQLLVGEGLKGHAAAVFLLADQHRQTAHPVPGGDDAVGGEDQDGHGTVDLLLGVADTGHQRILLIDEGGGQLRGGNFAGRHGHELLALLLETLLHQRLGVVDDAHGGDGVETQMGTDQQRLRVGVADTADAAGAGEFM